MAKKLRKLLRPNKWQLLWSLTSREPVKDIIVVVLLLIICLLIYLPFLTAAKTTVFGDEPRYHTYQTMLIRYSFEHFKQLGFWDSFISSGASWLSHPGGPQFSPFSWITALLFTSQYAAARFLLVSHISVAAIAFYVLARAIGLTRWTCFFIAIPFIANRYAITFSVNGWLEEIYGLYLLPLSVAFLLLACKRTSYFFAVSGGFIVAMHFFETTYYVFHYNVIVLVLLSAGLYGRALLGGRKDKKKLKTELVSLTKIHVVFWATAIGFAAIKILPLLEFRSISSRLVTPLKDIETPDAVMTFSYYAERLRNMIAEMHHAGATNTNALTQLGNTSAILMVCITFLAALMRKSYIYVIFGLMLVFGSWGFFANHAPFDLYAIVYHSLPGFNSNVFPYRFIIIIHFAFFVCLALGLDIFFQTKKFYLAKPLGIVLGIILVFSSSIYTRSMFEYFIPKMPQGFDVKTALGQKPTFQVDVLAGKNNPPKISGTLSPNLLVTLAILYRSYVPEGKVYANYNDGPSSITTVEALDAELPLTKHSYDAIVPTYEYNLLPANTAYDSLDIMQKKFKVLSVLNANFILEGKSLFEYQGCQSLALPVQEEASRAANEVCDFLEKRLTPLQRQGDGGLFFNNHVLPKVAVLGRAILLVSDNRYNDYNAFVAKQILLHSSFNEQTTSVFSERSRPLDNYSSETLSHFPVVILINPIISDQVQADRLLMAYQKQGGRVFTLNGIRNDYQNLHAQSGSLYTNAPAWVYSEQEQAQLADLLKTFEGTEDYYKSVNTAQIISYSPEKIVVKTNTKNANVVLQLSDSYYPGWHVKIDGKSEAIYMADGLVKGVILDHPGEHTVTFFYRPRSYLIGLSITILTFCCVVVGLIRRKRH